MVNNAGTAQAAARDAAYGQITGDAVARLRARVGIPVRNPAPPHYREPGVDAFRIALLKGDPLRGVHAFYAGTGRSSCPARRVPAWTAPCAPWWRGSHRDLGDTVTWETP
jgi:hypothetical protein